MLAVVMHGSSWWASADSFYLLVLLSTVLARTLVLYYFVLPRFEHGKIWLQHGGGDGRPCFDFFFFCSVMEGKPVARVKGNQDTSLQHADSSERHILARAVVGQGSSRGNA